MKTHSRAHHNHGFTLVELLVVIVVIAILAVISVIAFNGIQNRAAISLVEDGVKKTARAVEVDRVTRGHYASDLDSLNLAVLDQNSSVSYQYTMTENAGIYDYCLTGSYRSVVRHISSADPNTAQEGACSGHTAPRTSAIIVESAQTGEFSGPRATPFTIPIDITLSANDLVFILFNHDSVNTLTDVALNGSPMTSTYSRQVISTRPTTGRQAIAAYSGVATAGTGQITISNTGASPSTVTDAYGRYIIYVVRGASTPTSISFQHTTYGDKPLGEVMQPTAQSIGNGEMAIMSYLYYSYAGAPTMADASSPGMTWTEDVMRAGNTAMSIPSSSNSLSSFHAIAPESGEVSYQITMPASGTASYQGGGMVVFVIH